MGSSTVAEMVDWIDNKSGVAKVTNGTRTSQVGVVDAKPKYLRTYADGVWTDNLLALPRFSAGSSMRGVRPATRFG